MPIWLVNRWWLFTYIVIDIFEKQIAALGTYRYRRTRLSKLLVTLAVFFQYVEYLGTRRDQRLLNEKFSLWTK